GPPYPTSGCPDSNWGPLRPERSALPGGATPRDRHRLARLGELQDGPRADVRAFADEEMPAVGDHPQLGAQPPRVLESVRQRHLPVAGAPQDEHRGADAFEVFAGVLGRERDA